MSDSNNLNRKAEDHRSLLVGKKRKLIAVGSGILVLVIITAFVIVWWLGSGEEESTEQTFTPPTHSTPREFDVEGEVSRPIPNAAPVPSNVTPPVGPKPEDPNFTSQEAPRLIDELNAAVDAQPTASRKLNHFFLLYCDSSQSLSPESNGYPYSPPGDNGYPYEDNYGYANRNYDEEVSGLFERLRRDVISEDETTNALTTIPGSFSEAVREFC